MLRPYNDYLYVPFILSNPQAPPPPESKGAKYHNNIWSQWGVHHPQPHPIKVNLLREEDNPSIELR